MIISKKCNFQKFRIKRFFLIVLIIAEVSDLYSGNVIKEANTFNLDLFYSWVDLVTPTSTDTAVWDNTVMFDNSVSTGSNVSWAMLRIKDPGGIININNNTLTLGAGGIDMSASTRALYINSNIVLGANQSWDVNGGKILTVNGDISGACFIHKKNNGKLRLGSSNNTYSGGTIISAGTLQVGTNSTTGSLPGNVINNSSLIFKMTSVYNYTGIISGTGNLEQNGSATLILSNSNTYKGMTTVSSGILRISNPEALGATDSATIIAVNAALEIDGNFVASNSVDESFTLNGTGENNSGALRNISNEVDITGEINLASNTSIGNSAKNIFNFYGIISGGGTLTKVGTGPLALLGKNTYSSSTTINSGSIWTNNSNGFGSTEGNTIVNNGATFAIYGGVSISEPLVVNGVGNDNVGAIYSYSSNNVLSGTITLATSTDINVAIDNLDILGVIDGNGNLNKIGSGSLILSGDNNYSGATTITGGIIRLKNTNGLGSSDSATTIKSGAALEVQGGILFDKTITLNGPGILNGGALRSISGNNTFSGNATFISNPYLGVDTGQLTISGNLSGVSGFTKVGTGDLILSGVSTFIGTGTVLSGNLILACDVVSSDIDVKRNASLSGTGIINSLNVDSGGVIELNTGNLTINGNATFSETSIINMGIGTMSDTLIVGGKLTLNGIVNINSTTGFGPGTYTIMTYDTLSENTLSIGTKPNGSYTYSIVAASNRIDLVIAIGDSNIVPTIITAIEDVITIEDSKDTTIVDLNNIFTDVEDGNALTFTAFSSDSTLVNPIIDSVDSSLILSLVKDGNGSAFIVVLATDIGGFFISDTFTVLVAPVNDKPQILDTISNIQVDEDAKDTLIAILSNVFYDKEDGTDLEFGVISTNNLLVIGSLNSDTLVLGFKENAHGVANILISASDEFNSTIYDTVTITVNSVNDKPVLESVTPWAMEMNTSKTVTLTQVQASDIDGDKLSILIESGVNYSVDTSTITPTSGFVGILTPYIKVTDGIDTSNSLPIFVTVKSSGLNHAPILNGGLIKPIEKNSFIKVTTDMLDAYDQDGDSLTILIWDGDYYSIQGAKIIPDKGFTGIIEVAIQITDGIMISDLIDFEVSVFEKILDFYKGQVIISDTYEALIGPNPLSQETKELMFRTFNSEADRMQVIIFDHLANIIHKTEVNGFDGKFNHTWEINGDVNYRGKAFLVIMRYYNGNQIVRTEKEFIGIKR